MQLDNSGAHAKMMRSCDAWDHVCILQGKHVSVYIHHPFTSDMHQYIIKFAMFPIY